MMSFLRISKQNFLIIFTVLISGTIIYHCFFLLTNNMDISSTYMTNADANNSEYTANDLTPVPEINSKRVAKDILPTNNNTIKINNDSYNIIYENSRLTEKNHHNKTVHKFSNVIFQETKKNQTQYMLATNTTDDNYSKVILKPNISMHFAKNVTTKLSLPNCSNDRKSKRNASGPYVPLRRLVHFDLKGAPPKITYLLKLLPLVKKLGATGLLIEYEDMFPYEGILKGIAAINHYTKNEIQSLLNLARKLGLEVIPLVQTFGHLEFVLKLKNYLHLREDPSMPQSICPSRIESLLLVQEMIDQVVSLHHDAKWIHIGCDEVFQLGTCPVCRKRNRNDLFLQHVFNVASYIREQHGINPIIWDDMLHHISEKELQSYNLGNLVEPMMWTYISPIYYLLGHRVWSSFAQVFPYIWGASAFKGAFGPGLTIPNVTRHLNNNLAWTKTMNIEEKNFCEIRGLVLTGWQRYDHFATLCELLPPAIPSLAINLLATSHGYFNSSLHEQLFEHLNCTSEYDNLVLSGPYSDDTIFKSMRPCFFPGNDVFHIAYDLKTVQEYYKNTLAKKAIDDAWITDYNIYHNFSSVARINEKLKDIHMLAWKLQLFMQQCKEALDQVYDEYTSIEWIEQNIYYPMLKYLNELENNARSLLQMKSWPVRPLQGPRELIKMSKEPRSPVFRMNALFTH